MPHISDEKVREATGRDWPAWFDLLDELGGTELTHKEIVAMLGEQGLESGWWRQSVTNEFEKHIGRRETGSTTDADFQIGVQKTLPLDQSQVWDLVTSPECAREWLNTREPLPSQPGETVATDDGHSYELRSIEPGRRMRFRRTDGDSGQRSTVQLTLLPAKTGTALHFHHEGLNDGEHREEMRAHWRRIADKILGIV